MDANEILAAALAASALLTCAPAQDSSSKTPKISPHATVRHHKVAVEEEQPLSPEVTAGEAAIQKKDYASAEKSLRAAIQKNANDYRAWFDLAFVLNATAHKNEAVEAYRKSISLKPE